MAIEINSLFLSQGLIELREELQKASSTKQKLQLTKAFSTTREFLFEHGDVEMHFFSLNDREKLALYSVLAVGQGRHLFLRPGALEKKSLRKLALSLLAVEDFYSELGGVVGYHVKCLELAAEKQTKETKGRYHCPTPYDLSKENECTRAHTFAGIRHLDQIAEIYPLGGAADRLSLNKEEKDRFQIAATFEFCQKTLLERLIQDVQSREFLYYKLFGKQVRVPIVIMTSDEKGGTSQIRQMFDEQNWFGRAEEDFFLFSQPLVPAMNTRGEWCVASDCHPLFKPGGHGVIWKLARDKGALEWLKKKGKTKGLARQINNPVAGVDYGLLAFMGIGFEQDKDFGFAACPASKGMSEGINVVIEKGKEKCLTNIEYCDFDHLQFNPAQEDLLANTNLLFVDLETIEELLLKVPIPGMLINAKKIKYKTAHHVMKEEEVMRLESTMQNLADALTEEGDPSVEMSCSYITSNRREKTISTIKKEFAYGSSMAQTPEQCYLDMLKNGRDLLVNYCSFKVPLLRDSMSFFNQGPSFIFLYHPALGPNYEVIAQKIRRGVLDEESELVLDIADLYIEDLNIKGSLQISTEAVTGHRDRQGVIHYSQKTGKCVLKNVTVNNAGINREASRSFWKDEVVHREKCEIFIEEGGEFYAEDVCFEKNVSIVVGRGIKMTAFMKGEVVCLTEERLQEPSWSWEYSADPEKGIVLSAEQFCLTK